MPRRKKRRKKRLKSKDKRLRFFTPKFFVWLFSALVGAGIIWLAGYKTYTSAFFLINPDNVHSEIELNRNIVSKIENKSIFSVNPALIYSEIKESYPEYKDIAVTKIFPNALEVKAKKREPLVQVNGREFYLVDDQGVVIGKNRVRHFQEFPAIEGILNNLHLNLGDNVFEKAKENDKSQSLKAAFRLILSAEEQNLLEKINSLDESYRFKLSSVNFLLPQTVYFYLVNDDSSGNRIKVIINENEVEEKVGLLAQLMADKLKDKVSLLQYIDFRFQKVVVGFRR